jgi:hypothetical protein
LLQIGAQLHQIEVKEWVNSHTEWTPETLSLFHTCGHVIEYSKNEAGIACHAKQVQSVVAFVHPVTQEVVERVTTKYEFEATDSGSEADFVSSVFFWVTHNSVLQHMRSIVEIIAFYCNRWLIL